MIRESAGSVEARLSEVKDALARLLPFVRAETERIAKTGDGGVFSGSRRRADELNTEKRDLERLLRAKNLTEQ